MYGVSLQERKPVCQPRLDGTVTYYLYRHERQMSGGQRSKESMSFDGGALEIILGTILLFLASAQ